MCVTHRIHVVMVYLLTFTIKINQKVGKYTIHGYKAFNFLGIQGFEQLRCYSPQTNLKPQKIQALELGPRKSEKTTRMFPGIPGP